MSIPEKAGLILASLALAIVGCESSPKPEVPAEHRPEVKAPEAPTEVSTVEPPVVPSPVPSLPDTPRGDLDKKEEAKPKEEPK